MSDTPETDAEITHVIEADGTKSCRPWVRMDFARRLERERNEARKFAEAYRRACDQIAAALDEVPNTDPLPWMRESLEDNPKECLPEGAVFLGRGLEFKTTEIPFEGWLYDTLASLPHWIGCLCHGASKDLLYAAPKDSEIVRLNFFPTKTMNEEQIETNLLPLDLLDEFVKEHPAYDDPNQHTYSEFLKAFKTFCDSRQSD